MARYDVYPGSRGLGFLLDCQSDLLDDLVTRVVVPLMPVAGFEPVPRLNPVFVINDETMVMATQLIFAIPRERLRRPVANLGSEHFTIVGALDVLLTGY
jgi:toxin CcdB